MADVIIFHFMYSKQREKKKFVKVWQLREQSGSNKRHLTIYTQQYLSGKRK